MSVAPSPPKAKAEPLDEPAWDVALLFPRQGHWTELDYFGLETRLLVEYCDGMVEVLPMPSILHQRIAVFIYGLLLAYIKPRGLGELFFPPTRVRVRQGKYREPDIVLVLSGRPERFSKEFITEPDLVVEVVSEDDPARDLKTKRLEYAEAGIPEYWIVNPLDQTITVLVLEGNAYIVHGEFSIGQTATSRLLPGFSVDVAGALSAKP